MGQLVKWTGGIAPVTSLSLNILRSVALVFTRAPTYKYTVVQIMYTCPGVPAPYLVPLVDVPPIHCVTMAGVNCR